MLDRFRYVALKSGVSDRWLASSMLDGRERNDDDGRLADFKRGILLSASPIPQIAGFSSCFSIVDSRVEHPVALTRCSLAVLQILNPSIVSNRLNRQTLF